MRAYMSISTGRMTRFATNARIVTTARASAKAQLWRTPSCLSDIGSGEIGKVLSWVHVAIANAKTRLANIYHGIKPDFLQGYLNEFCYKFNRRYFGERLFDRMLVAVTSYTPSFRNRVYNSNITTS